MWTKAPNIWKLKDIHNIFTSDTKTEVEINGNWYPARPIGLFSLKSRLGAAWLVFKGEADALVWPQDDIGLHND